MSDLIRNETMHIDPLHPAQDACVVADAATIDLDLTQIEQNNIATLAIADL